MKSLYHYVLYKIQIMMDESLRFINWTYMSNVHRLHCICGNDIFYYSLINYDDL